MKRSVVSCWLLVACAMTAGAVRAGDPVAEGKVLGYQLDVSRCKVPTMPTLHRIVDILDKFDCSHS